MKLCDGPVSIIDILREGDPDSLTSVEGVTESRVDREIIKVTEVLNEGITGIEGISKGEFE